MKNNSRIYAAIHMDALEQNLENMRKNLTPGTKMIGVIQSQRLRSRIRSGCPPDGEKGLYLGICGGKCTGSGRTSGGWNEKTDPDSRLCLPGRLSDTGGFGDPTGSI